MKHVEPKTSNQALSFREYYKNKNLLLHGIAGTGKTFACFNLALKEILSGKSPYKKLFIIRSMVPGRDSGFLPGSLKEKARVYEAPYAAICAELFERGDAYDILKNRGIIEFPTTSYLRGVTFRDCMVIIDEFQNANWQEIHTTITRIGENCKVLVCGDTKQDDLTGKRRGESSAALDVIKVIEKMPSFAIIRFGIEDIVRSDLVKEWILATNKLGL